MSITFTRTIRAFAHGLGCLWALCAFDQASAAVQTWVVSPATGNWSNTANWGGGTLATGDSLVFGNSSITSLANDLSGLSLAGLTFNAGAPAYTIGGNSFTLTGNVTNNSTVLQTISAPLVLAGERTFTLSAGGGNLLINGGVSGSTGSLTVSGTGQLTLAGTNTHNITTEVRGNTVLNLTGTINSTQGFLAVGTFPESRATIIIQNNITTPRLSVGGLSGGTSSVKGAGAVYQTAGAVVLTDTTSGSGSTAPERIFALGAAGASATFGGYGYYSLAGGSLSAKQFTVGANGNNSIGMMEVSGGSMSATHGITIGRGNGSLSLSYGVLDVRAGTVTWGNTVNTSPLAMGYTTNGLSTLNVGGGASAASVTGPSSASGGIELAAAAQAANVAVNLRTNGTLTTSGITATQSAPNAHVNFDGGTLKATSTNAGTNFLSSPNIDAINVYAGGGTLHNNGTTITIARPLAAPAGNGVTSVPITAGGSGYIGAPILVFSGGGGTGASGHAVVTAGVITGIVITSPGIGYTSAPTVTLSGGGALTLATLGSVSLGANTSGGMTYTGSGTTRLTATSTYTGTTTITSGSTLSLGDGTTQGGLSAASSIANQGTLSVHTLTTQTLDNSITGTGTLIKAGPGTLILPGANTATGTTTISSGTLAVESSLATSSAIVNNATLTFQGTGSSTVPSVISGSGQLIKAGTGMLTLAGANTLSGGMTLSSGTLNLTHASALGTGTFTLQGGVIDNTSGGPLTLTTNNALNIQSDFTFGGSNDLNLGTGAVSLNANRIVTLQGNTTLTIGGDISGAYSLTGSGTGQLMLAGMNLYTGTTTATAGTTIVVGTNNALGTTAGGTSVESGGTLRLQSVNYTAAEPLQIRGTGANNAGALRNTGTSTYAGTITAATNATIHAGSGQLTTQGGLVKDGTTLTIKGPGKVIVENTGISGSSANSDLVVDGATVVVNATSNYNGPTYIENAASLAINAPITTTSLDVDATSTASGTSSIIHGSGNVLINGALIVGDHTLSTPTVSQLSLVGSGTTEISSTGELRVELFARGGNLSGNAAAADRLRLFGPLVVSDGATLIVNPNGQTGFADGDRWTLIELGSGGTISGQFTVQMSNVPSHLLAVFSNSTGVLSIIAIPEPSRAVMLCFGISIMMLRKRRALSK